LGYHFNENPFIAAGDFDNLYKGKAGKIVAKEKNIW
jgi:hypothetical protein